MFPRGTIFLLCLAPAFADEKVPPPEKSAPPAEDAIAVAKREFDAVKSARSTAEQAKLGLPQFQTPELRPTTMGATPLLRSPNDKDAAALKKKNANWLVDAMTESEKEQNRKKAGTDSRRKDSDDTVADSERERDSLDPNETKTEPTQKKNAEPEPNPLDRYMASWMTPQDLSLLKPALASGASQQDASRFDSAAGNFSANLPGSSPVDSLGLLSSGSATSATIAPPRDNPFLQSLASPSTLAGLAPVNASSPAAQPPAPASQLAAPPVPAAPRTVKPDFVKPREDEKYYKPMKRF